MTAPYLATLNPEQRRAVEYGGDGPSPLLIIAGAGSGKTNTLAHRVAHLIVNQVLPEQGWLMVDALNLSGTFHAIGARLLR